MALWTTKEGKRLRVSREKQLLLALTKCRDAIALHLPRDECLEQAITDADLVLRKEGLVYMKPDGRLYRIPFARMDGVV